jgi:hypothetical protein
MGPQAIEYRYIDGMSASRLERRRWRGHRTAPSATAVAVNGDFYSQPASQRRSRRVPQPQQRAELRHMAAEAGACGVMLLLPRSPRRRATGGGGNGGATATPSRFAKQPLRNGSNRRTAAPGRGRDSYGCFRPLCRPRAPRRRGGGDGRHRARPQTAASILTHSAPTEMAANAVRSPGRGGTGNVRTISCRSMRSAILPVWPSRLRLANRAEWTIPEPLLHRGWSGILPLHLSSQPG